MKNIHLIPTDKPSRLYLTKKGFYFLLPNIKGNDAKFQHIYITNDEEIKEGDWILNETHNIEKAISHYNYKSLSSDCKKIILTTDQDLIADGVQPIPDDFLEWFVENPSCEEVEVKWIKTPDGIFYHKDNVPYGCYKIIITKEEHEQETLEEAAEKYADFNNDYVPLAFGSKFNETTKRDFIAGAKWQQERMYSKEEMIVLLNKYNKHTLKLQELKLGNSFDVKEWFEQFKKK